MQKTALCLLGTGRSIEYTFENLKEFLINDLTNCDVIVYLTKNDKSDLARKYFETLSNAKIYVVEEAPLNTSEYTFMADWPSRPNSSHQIYLQMIKSRSYMNELIELQNKDYDRVIFSRMDVIYQKRVAPLIKDLDLSNIWIPNFHNWLGGYNDRFAVSSKQNMFDYFSIYEYAKQYCFEKHVLHAERTLRHHLSKKKCSVKIFNILFARVDGKGKPRETFEKLLTDEDAILPCDI